MLGLPRKKQSDQPSRRSIARGRQEQRATLNDLDDRYTFRRNYTITGSSSTQVTTPNEPGSQLKSSRTHAHHLARQRRHAGLALLGVGATCLFLFMIISQFTARVALTIDGDASIIAKSDYTQTITTYLSQSPVERLRFATNQERLTRFVQAAHPEVAQLKLDGSAGFGVSRIWLTTRTPVVGWSADGREEYVDTTGTAFVVNYHDRPTVKIVDNSGIEATGGQTIASDSFLSFIGQVVGLADNSEQQLIVTKITIPAATTRQIEVSLQALPYPVKMTTERPAGEQVEDMVRAVQWMRQRGVVPKYIDVRVSGEAFYRTD